MRKYLHLKFEGINHNDDIWNSIVADEFDSKLQHQLFKRINIENHILIRGLSYLLKSQLLMSTNYYFFIEEAALLVHLAMEASIKYIQKHSQNIERRNPSINDVFKYINKN